MLKKTITYTDFNDNVQTEDLYFNISKPELTAMQIETDGGLDKKIARIVENKDLAEAMKLFNTLIVKSYGIKSEDGKRFIKNDKLAEEFIQSLAYEQLYSEILSTEDSAINFILGVLPRDVAEQAKEEIKKNA